MTAVALLILAVVQGIAEFLPISSSGHLLIAGWLLGGAQATPLLASVALHFGTLISIVIFYRRRLRRIARSERRLLPLVAVATVPAVVVGVFARRQLMGLLESVTAAGVFLMVTGLLLLASRWLLGGRTVAGELSVPAALLVGCFQAFALLPGISRSGATIVAGLAVGLKRSEAATFSFLIALPAILGATCLELFELSRSASAAPVPIGWLAVATAIAAIVGLLALNLLVRLVDSGRLHLFAWWCLPLGFVVVVTRLLGG